MKTIYLHGYLKEKFGEKFTFDVTTPQMAVRALISQLKEFSSVVSPGQFVIILGDQKRGFSLGAEDLRLKFGKLKEMHIIPHVKGAGGRAGGIIKIVLGVALIATGIGGAFVAGGAAVAGATAGATVGFVAGLNTAAFLGISWGAIAAVGLGLALSGVSSLTSSRMDLSTGQYEDRESADERPSFLFNGPRNQSGQGLPVPLIYGTMRVGSNVVSVGIQTEKL